MQKLAVQQSGSDSFLAQINNKPILLALLLSAGAPVAHAGPDPCALGSAQTLAVTNSGFSAFAINSINNPTLTVVRGCTYTFNINAAGHPFFIKTVQGTGVGNAYSNGVTGNATQVGTLTWTVANDAPNSLFYNCQFHSPMTGSIQVIDGGPPDAVFLNGFE